MNSYGQFCPVAKAMELLDERWTVLVVRELVLGSRHFNELRRGVPRMSPALLSKRLRTLTKAGIIERYQDGNRISYALTPAGRELEPIILALGTWSVRWIPQLGDEDLDPHLLLWDMHRSVDAAAVPDRRVVVHVRFRELPATANEWWLMIRGEHVDLCDFDPGHGTDVTIDTTLRTLTRIWRCDIEWREAMLAGDLRLEGPPRLRRALPSWFISSWADIPRPLPVH